MRTLCFSDIADLEAKENIVDELIRNCSLQLKMMTEDPENARLAYVTYQDIRSIKSFEEQTVIAIKAPPETRLEVPDPAEVRRSKHLFLIIDENKYFATFIFKLLQILQR